MQIGDVLDDIATEPPDGAVVIDSVGVPFYNNKGYWIGALRGCRPLQWADMHSPYFFHVPYRIVHLPESVEVGA